MRVVVAMSGGVDSSVAAALLIEAGHQVIGLSMRLSDQASGASGTGSCGTPRDLCDARRAASALGVPHRVVNLTRRFEERVVAGFVREYLDGRTPLPCARCNSELKFVALLEAADEVGASHVATGHYARVEADTANSRFTLKRGVDPEKDQSFFLFALTQAQLARAVFPLGTWRKTEVRRYARTRGVPVADKPESQEICFVPDNDYAAFVARRAPPADRSGIIVDAGGRVLGRHDGAHHFTVGQRKGLRVSGPSPLYVLRIDAASRTVLVGPRSALDRTSLTASGVNWISGNPPSGPLSVTAQIRSRHPAASARIEAVEGDRVALVFDEPQPAITPGQAAVWYDGDELLGGGWID